MKTLTHTNARNLRSGDKIYTLGILGILIVDSILIDESRSITGIEVFYGSDKSPCILSPSFHTNLWNFRQCVEPIYEIYHQSMFIK